MHTYRREELIYIAFLNMDLIFKNALKGFRTPDLKLTKLALC
jgi:hypothetical protein